VIAAMLDDVANYEKGFGVCWDSITILFEWSFNVTKICLLHALGCTSCHFSPNNSKSTSDQHRISKGICMRKQI